MIRVLSFMSTDLLKSIFGHNELRQGQQEVIDAIVAGKDIIVLMPTGAGKSLCFQLPAVSAKGVTIVISPLISLIYDQIQDLRSKGVIAHFLNSTVTQSDLAGLMSDLEILPDGTCKCKLVYITPEVLSMASGRNEEFLEQLDRLYETNLLEGFVIDEAHCVSNWGHDFRESYLNLRVIKDYYSLIPIWAFTATATQKVQQDIISQLQIKNPEIFKTSFIRKNLSYQIYEKTHDLDSRVAALIKSRYDGKTGLVYCLRRADCEKLAGYLRTKGISADHYHAQISPAQKTQVQQKWLDGGLKVIVATIAFALGINKPDVRFVIHTAMPMSIESYYQETGRAGRDGGHSDCILFYSHQDKIVLEKLSEKSDGSGHAPTSAKVRISLMYRMCTNKFDCLKQQMCHYLGEYIEYQCSPEENQCSCCRDKIAAPDVDITAISLDILNHTYVTGRLEKSELSTWLKTTSWTAADLSRIAGLLLTRGYLKTQLVIKKGIIEEYLVLGSGRIQSGVVLTMKGSERPTTAPQKVSIFNDPKIKALFGK